MNALHAVVQEKDLTSPLEFPADGVPDDALVLTVNGGVDGDFPRQRRIDCRHVTRAHE